MATLSAGDVAPSIPSSPQVPQAAAPLYPQLLFLLPQPPPVPSAGNIFASPAALQFLFPFISALSTLLNPRRPQSPLLQNWTLESWAGAPSSSLE